MKTLPLPVALFTATAQAQQASSADVTKWERQAKGISIVRDDWGIAHIHGKTDADAVFGLMYAQAEDDFNRVETNYINSMGRLAEAEGEAEVWRDLRMKLFIDPDSMKAKYEASPAWLKCLMNAFADGLNYYLARNPQVTPRVIRHFEPWMALTFSEGSIGGDIEKVNLAQLQAFYGKPDDGIARDDRHARDDEKPRDDETARADLPAEPGGSNGAAVAPANTTAHHALLLINPHTSFFFRSELQMTSDEGLGAYGAVTWGQFFVYQGFNERVGFMHTSTTADAVDEYAETVVRKADKLYYRHGKELRPLEVS